ncbi:glycosyltransferase family 2 protein [Methylobacterium nigriterrae]|uniref:glycosyltransferase family 2 protein n=1 Tax=Methylobacterium nigriterrae TaxID=3127512 RepID=UPI00301361A5
MPSVTLVGIAKNEGRYIAEWLAFHRAVGFGPILVYDNDSTDGTAATVTEIARRDPGIKLTAWPTGDISPQVSAYNDSLRRVGTPWVTFLDIDEFMVPFAHGSIQGFLETVPEDVASVHVNWRCFGSGGRASDAYGLVTRAFTRGAEVSWDNHKHFKTLARTELATEVLVHDVRTRGGRRVLSDFTPLIGSSAGAADRVAHAGIQINHYQSKTYPEFRRRMANGNADAPAGHEARPRDDSAERFAALDRNEVEDRRIRRFDRALDASLRRLTGRGAWLRGLVPGWRRAVP